MARTATVTLVRTMATPKPFMLQAELGAGLGMAASSGGDAASAVMTECVLKIPVSPNVIPAYMVGLRRISRLFIFPMGPVEALYGTLWPNSRVLDNAASITWSSFRNGGTNHPAGTIGRFYGLFIGD
jgi:hypothetical protein